MYTESCFLCGIHQLKIYILSETIDDYHLLESKREDEAADTRLMHRLRQDEKKKREKSFICQVMTSAY